MSLEGNDVHTVALKERHVRNVRQIVRIDVERKLWFELKALLMQEPSRDSVVSGHVLYLRAVYHKAALRLRYIHQPPSGKPRDIFCWRMAVYHILLRYGFRLHSSSVITEGSQNAFHESVFAVSGGLAIEEEHTLVAGIAGESIAETLLKEYCLLAVARHDSFDELIESVIACIRVIIHIGQHGDLVLRVVLTECHRP